MRSPESAIASSTWPDSSALESITQSTIASQAVLVAELATAEPTFASAVVAQGCTVALIVVIELEPRPAGSSLAFYWVLYFIFDSL